MGRKSKKQLIKEARTTKLYEKRFARLNAEYKAMNDLFTRFGIVSGSNTFNNRMGYSYILRVRVEIKYKDPGHVAYKKPRITGIAFFCDEDQDGRSLFGYSKWYSLLDEIEDISFKDAIDIVTNWLLARKQSQIEILNNMDKQNE